MRNEEYIKCKKLIFQIIAKAAEDLYFFYKKEKKINNTEIKDVISAINFFNSNYFKELSEMIDIDPEYYKNKIKIYLDYAKKVI